MRRFFKGFLLGTAAVCVLTLGWLLVIQPGITRSETQSMKSKFTLAPGADHSGGAALQNTAGQAEPEVPPLNFSALQTAYPDVKAWLTVPGTVIDYPVLQSSAAAPEYYLRRSVTGEYRLAGSLFFQSDCQPESRSLVIFGHNMNDGTMFGCLPKYFDPAYCATHDRLVLETPDGIRAYRIAAVLETDASKAPFYRTSFANDEDFLAHAQTLQSNSLINTDVPITADSRLLVLVTCSYAWEDARVVIVGVQT